MNSQASDPKSAEQTSHPVRPRVPRQTGLSPPVPVVSRHWTPPDQDYVAGLWSEHSSTFWKARQPAKSWGWERIDRGGR